MEMGQGEEKVVSLPRKSRKAGHKQGRINPLAPNKVKGKRNNMEMGQGEEKELSLTLKRRKSGGRKEYEAKNVDDKS